jgi:hypothetical protein
MDSPPDTLSQPFATAPAAARRLRLADHRFYAGACAAAFAIVFAGFARTYYLRVLFGQPPLPWLLHLHGALMTSWFVLFFVQTRLIASHLVHLHRRLGIFGGVLAGLIVIIGSTVAIRATARDVHLPGSGGPPPLVFMGFILAALLVFAVLVGAALVLRRRRDYHKRLMLLSCLSMIGPGLTRIPLERFPAALAFLKSGGWAGLFSLDAMVLYACIAWDTARHRRLHPAFVGGGLLIIMVEDLPFIWHFLSTPIWLHFAAGLVR